MSGWCRFEGESEVGEEVFLWMGSGLRVWWWMLYGLVGGRDGDGYGYGDVYVGGGFARIVGRGCRL